MIDRSEFLERIGSLGTRRPVRACTIDIETSPNLVWRFSLFDKHPTPIDAVHTPARVICFAVKWLDTDEVEFFAEWHKGGHRAMMRKAWKVLNEADYVIGFNQVSFDTPWLHTEFFRLGWGPPAPHKEVDLRKVTKQRFRFPSGKLDWLSRELGVGAKVEHEGMPLWLKVLDGDADARRRMGEYNVHDVELTEDLYFLCLPWIKNHPNVGLLAGIEGGCTNCGGVPVPQGEAFGPATIYQRYRCKDCGAWQRGAVRIGPEAPPAFRGITGTS